MQPPDATIVTLFSAAGLVIVAMAMWAGVTAFRILFSDPPVPADPVARRRLLAARGESVPVRLRDIMEDERARQSVSATPAPRAGSPTSGASRANPLFDDLWLRRN